MKTKLVYIFILFYSSSLFCQTDEYISFREVLSSWEERYDVSFSYADEDLAHIYLPSSWISRPSIKFDSLYVGHDFPFVFKILPRNIVAVVPKNDTQKITFQTLDFERGTPVTSEIQMESFLLRSKDDGWFRCLLSTKFTELTITSPNYAAHNFTLTDAYKRNRKQVYLIPNNIELSEILLTNYITKGIDLNRRGDLQFKPNEFGILPGQIEADVLQSIQLMPGIISAEESVSYINVRGGTHDQNLFLFDGIKRYQTAHFFGMISVFNPYMVASTTLTKNGTSSAYGESVSSVIELKSSEKIAKDLSVQVGANLISTDVFIDAPLRENMSFQLATRRSITDVYKGPTYQRFYDKVFQNTSVSSSSLVGNDTDEFNFLDTSFRLNYQPSEKDYIRLNLSYFSNNFTIQQANEDFPLSFERESSLNQQDVGFGMYYRRKHNQKWNTGIQYYFTDYSFSGFNLDLNNNQSLLQKNALQEYGVKLISRYEFTKLWQIKAGVQINETSVTNLEEVNNPLFFRSIQEAIFSSAGFTSLVYNNTQTGTFLDAGIRANFYTKFNDWYVEPRITVSQRIFDNFTLQLKAEQKSQITSQVIDLQTDFLGVENRRWVIANEANNIPIISSNQYSFGLHYRKRNFLASFEVFQKEVKGITSQSQGFVNQFQFSQTHGDYLIKGFDVLLNQQFKDITAWFNYSFADNTYFFSALEPQQFRHNLDITHVISAGANYDINNWKFSTGVTWHSGVPTTALEKTNSLTSGNQVDFGQPNSINLPYYFRWDASVNYKFQLSEKAQAVSGVSFWNILNRSNVYNRFYSTNNDGNIIEVDQLALKFTPNFTFRVVW